jgi:hypothetical protein
MSSKPMLPPFDHSDLPVGLPEHVYATWLAARRNLCNSKNLEQSELRFEFCCGYVQALTDGQVIDGRYGVIMRTHLREIWFGLLNHFTER